MVISFNIVCFNGLHLANPPTWIWMVQFILYGLLQWIASGKPTSVGLDSPIHLYGLLQWIASAKPTSVGLDGPIHLYGLLQWIASGKPTSVVLDGPIHLYGLLQWIASGKPTSVGLDGSIHFIWVKKLNRDFRIQTCCNHFLSAAEGFQVQEATCAEPGIFVSFIKSSAYFTVYRGGPMVLLLRKLY